MIRQRLLGGLALAAGAFLIVIGLCAIAADLWPDGEITSTRFLVYTLAFLLPGLIAMGIGARLGRGDREG